MPYLIGFFLFFILSLWERVRSRRVAGMEKKELPMEPRPSPVSLALGELLAVAGGIYLTLLMAVTFLGLEIPARIPLGNLYLEPLAAISLVLALMQPFLAWLWPRR
ncbi:MAG: hypothetical protein GX349_05635 [Firmicutes bacterium]|nr:hypothetical protein [Bacillota bacterium]